MYNSIKAGGVITIAKFLKTDNGLELIDLMKNSDYPTEDTFKFFNRGGC